MMKYCNLFKIITLVTLMLFNITCVEEREIPVGNAVFYTTQWVDYRSSINVELTDPDGYVDDRDITIPFQPRFDSDYPQTYQPGCATFSNVAAGFYKYSAENTTTHCRWEGVVDVPQNGTVAVKLDATGSCMFWTNQPNVPITVSVADGINGDQWLNQDIVKSYDKDHEPSIDDWGCAMFNSLSVGEHAFRAVTADGQLRWEGTVKVFRDLCVTICLIHNPDDNDDTNDDTPVSEVSLSSTELKLEVGQSHQLRATVLPTDATNPVVKWTSSNPDVAQVNSSGYVKANKRGSTVIVASTVDGGFTATCQVDVMSFENKKTYNVNGVTFSMMHVKGSDFDMGDANFGPVHNVTLSEYWMGQTEVTQELWRAVMGSNPSYHTTSTRCPVDNVNWYDICDMDGFLSKLNSLIDSKIPGYRFALPSEAQWEFAARGGRQSAGYLYAGSNNVENVAWCGQNSDGQSHPVAKKMMNELGLYDMSGNVWEWCNDLYADYTSTSQTDPTGPSDGTEFVILRGGSYYNNEDIDFVPCVRLPNEPDGSYSNVGFRLALVPTSAYNIPIAELTLSLDNLHLAIGKTSQLTAVVKPLNATNRQLTWSSDNASVATVDDAGKVTAVGVGYATITVTTEDGGKTATCSVTVTEDSSGEKISFTANGVTFEMVYVMGATFWMGAQKDDPSGQNYDSEANSYESPVHQVTLSDYYVGQTEVTQGLWEAVMGTDIWDQRDLANPDWPLYGEGDSYPMYYVSWDDIQTFLSKLNSITGKTFVLPTEAQWEFAARGGTKSNGYKYSGGNDIDAVAWYSSNSSSSTHSVGTKQPNELGIYDMSGNVWELGKDWFGSYGSSSQTNPQGPSSGSYRVLRGGSWYDDAVSCRASNRGIYTPGSRYSNVGFRLALVL